MPVAQALRPSISKGILQWDNPRKHVWELEHKSGEIGDPEWLEGEHNGLTRRFHRHRITGMGFLLETAQAGDSSGVGRTSMLP